MCSNYTFVFDRHVNRIHIIVDVIGVCRTQYRVILSVFITVKRYYLNHFYGININIFDIYKYVCISIDIYIMLQIVHKSHFSFWGGVLSAFLSILLICVCYDMILLEMRQHRPCRSRLIYLYICVSKWIKYCPMDVIICLATYYIANL